MRDCPAELILLLLVCWWLIWYPEAWFLPLLVPTFSLQKYVSIRCGYQVMEIDVCFGDPGLWAFQSVVLQNTLWGSDLFILTRSGCSEYARKCSPGSGAILSLMFMFPHRPVSSSTTISQVPVAPTTGLFISWTHPALSHCCDFVILTPFGIFLPFLYLHIDSSYSPTTR